MEAAGGTFGESERWVIERTFGWLGRHRRLSKNDEPTPATSLAWVRLALMAILVQRFGAT